MWTEFLQRISSIIPSQFEASKARSVSVDLGDDHVLFEGEVSLESGPTNHWMRHNVL